MTKSVAAICILVGFSLRPTCGAEAAKTPTVRIGSGSVLELLVRYRPPRYPTVSLEAHVSGLAVAEVETYTNGAVKVVRVDRAPDKHIANSVRMALRKWKFQPVTINNTPARVKTRIFVYFRLRGGASSVIIAGLEKPSL